MSPRQTGQLLVLAAVVDNREVTEATVLVWHEALAATDFDDARTALAEHRRDSTEYLQPAHIVAGARRLADRRARLAEGRELRAGTVSGVPKPADFDRVYEDELAARRAQRDSGLDRAIAAHPSSRRHETHRPDLTDADIEAELYAIGARRRAAREELAQRQQGAQS